MFQGFLFSKYRFHLNLTNTIKYLGFRFPSNGNIVSSRQPNVENIEVEETFFFLIKLVM